METLYKVLLAVCGLFLLAGFVYVLYYLPQVPSTPAQPEQSWSGCLSAQAGRI